MAFIRRIVKSSEILPLFKTNSLSLKNSWNVEFASVAKKVDLPCPPKKPLTAYMLFCKEQRKDLLKEYPLLTSPQQIRKLAEKWGHLTNDMKKPYEISAREKTVLYGEEHKKFYENLTAVQKEEMARLKSEKKESRRLLRLKRALKSAGLPKPAAPAYALFVQSQAKMKGEIKQAAEFIKQAAEKWRNLSDVDKKVFEAKAVADKTRFVNEMEQWRKQLIAEGNTSLLKDYDGLKGRGKVDGNEVMQRALLRAKMNAASDGKKAAKKSELPKN